MPSLRFGADGTFTMVQFADLHYGESPEADRNSTRVMSDVLDAEAAAVDLVVFSGDQVSGYALHDPRAAWVASLMPAAHR